MEAANAEFTKMLRYAAAAGGCYAEARREPGATRGLMKCASQYSAKATALLNVMATGPMAEEPIDLSPPFV